MNNKNEIEMPLNAGFVEKNILVAERELPVEDDYYATFVSATYTVLDHDLFSSKWFDYRHLTPFEATCEYIRRHDDIYRRIMAREFSRTRAEHVFIPSVALIKAKLRNGDTKTKKQFAGFWRGRQVADAIGMPYADYIDLAMTYRLRHWANARMPNSDQLYHRFDVERITLRWEELQTAKPYVSDHPAYLGVNYRGTEAQKSYHEWLFKQAELNGGPRILAEFVLEDRLPESKVRARLDAFALEKFDYYLS